MDISAEFRRATVSCVEYRSTLIRSESRNSNDLLDSHDSIWRFHAEETRRQIRPEEIGEQILCTSIKVTLAVVLSQKKLPIHCRAWLTLRGRLSSSLDRCTLGFCSHLYGCPIMGVQAECSRGISSACINPSSNPEESSNTDPVRMLSSKTDKRNYLLTA